MSISFGDDTKLIVIAHQNTKIISIDLNNGPEVQRKSKHLIFFF